MSDNDTKSREIEGGTSVVDYSSVRKIKPPRVLFALSLGGLYVLVGLFSAFNADVARFFRESGFTELPIPTEWVLAFGAFLQTKLGMGLAAFSFLSVILLVLKGTLDKILRILIGVNIVAIIGFLGFSLYGSYAPMLKKKMGAPPPATAPAPAPAPPKGP
jgi:hypothetical protein